MIGVEFEKDKIIKEPNEGIHEMIEKYGSRQRLLLLDCGKSVIRLMHPLGFTEEQMDKDLELLEHVSTKAGQEQGLRKME